MLAHIHDQEIEIGEVPPPARKDKAVLAPLLSRQPSHRQARDDTKGQKEIHGWRVNSMRTR